MENSVTEAVFDQPQPSADQPPAFDVSVVEKRLADKDSFIDQLKSENKELREELDKRLAVEEAVKSGTSEKQTPIDVQTIKSVMQEISSDERRTLNLKSTQDKMVELFGSVEKANEVTAQKAQELGVSVSWLGDIAKTSPDSFMSLVAGDKKVEPAQNSNPKSTVTMTTSSEAERGTKAYYDNLRRSDPRKYFLPETQIQLLKDRKEKGEAFYR